jgi:Predicted phosphatase/phosphohexomutase
MEKVKAALFDLDGVVFDTEPQYTVFWGAQCREFHPEHPGLEHEIKGQTLDQIYDAWFGGSLTEKRPLITERLNAYEQQMDYQYIEGFEAFVKQLPQRGRENGSGDEFQSTEDEERLSAASGIQGTV